MEMKKFKIEKARKTAFGRILCRFLGDENGAIALEYVVLALLIIAAAVGAVVYFGRTMKTGLEGAANTITDTDKTVEQRTEETKGALKDTKNKGIATSNATNKNLTGAGGEAKTE